MQKFPVPPQGQITAEQIKALKAANILGGGTQAFASYQDWIGKTGYGPPQDPNSAPKLWSDSYSWGGRWYVFAGPEVTLDAMLQDRISAGIYSPGAYTFFRTNKEFFPRVPSLNLVWLNNGFQLNIPNGTVTSGQLPVGWLEYDPVGPIDYVQGSRIREKTEGPAPNGEKYRVNGFRSDMAAIYENGVFTMFLYAEWKAPATGGGSASWPLLGLSAVDQVQRVSQTLYTAGDVIETARQLAALYGK